MLTLGSWVGFTSDVSLFVISDLPIVLSRSVIFDIPSGGNVKDWIAQLSGSVWESYSGIVWDSCGCQTGRMKIEWLIT